VATNRSQASSSQSAAALLVAETARCDQYRLDLLRAESDAFVGQTCRADLRDKLEAKGTLLTAAVSQLEIQNTSFASASAAADARFASACAAADARCASLERQVAELHAQSSANLTLAHAAQEQGRIADLSASTSRAWASTLTSRLADVVDESARATHAAQTDAVAHAAVLADLHAANITCGTLAERLAATAPAVALFGEANAIAGTFSAANAAVISGAGVSLVPSNFTFESNQMASPDGHRAETARLGHEIYGGSSFSVVTNAALDAQPVGTTYDRHRRLCRGSWLWGWNKSRMTNSAGTAPRDCDVQTEMEAKLYGLNAVFRWPQRVLTALVQIKGINHVVQRILSVRGVMQQRSAGNAAQRRAEQTFLPRVAAHLTCKPTNPCKLASDNFQQGNKGAFAALGDAHQALFHAGTDGIATHLGNAPRSGTDPFLLPAGATAWSQQIDVAYLEGRLTDAIGMPLLLDALSCEVGDASLAYAVEECPATEPSVVKWHRRKDGVFRALSSHAVQFYKTHPSTRRGNPTFGIKDTGAMPLGFTNDKSSSWRDTCGFIFYLHKILFVSRVDADLVDEPEEEEDTGGARPAPPTPPAPTTQPAQTAALPPAPTAQPAPTMPPSSYAPPAPPAQITQPAQTTPPVQPAPPAPSAPTAQPASTVPPSSSAPPAPHAQITQPTQTAAPASAPLVLPAPPAPTVPPSSPAPPVTLRRARYLQSDNQCVPHVLKLIVLSRFMGSHIMDTMMPMCEPWHAVKCLLTKYVLGSGHDDMSQWTKRVFFDEYFRFHRDTDVGADVDWGRISTRYRFDEYYYVCKVTMQSWLSVRETTLNSLTPEQHALPAVELLLGFLEHDLPVGLYYLLAHKLSPDLVVEFDWAMSITCAKYNCTGYMRDIARKQHDYSKLSAPMRAACDENPEFAIGVAIEHMHGRAAACTVDHHTHTHREINKVYANFTAVDNALELLSKMDGEGKPLDKTYSIPDTHKTTEITAHMANHLVARFEQAVSAASSVANGTLTTAAFGFPLSCSANLLPSHAAAHRHEIINPIVTGLQNQNSIEKILPNNTLPFRNDQHQRTGCMLSETQKPDLLRRLRLLCLAPADGKQGVADLRALLAPDLRSRYLGDMTARDDPELHAVVEMINKAEVGDFSFVPDHGVFTKFDAAITKSDANDPDVATVADAPESEMGGALAPPDWVISNVAAPPPLAVIMTNNKGKKYVVKTDALMPFLGSSEKPTFILVYFKPSLESNDPGGWFMGYIKHANKKQYAGLTTSKAHFAEGLNYKVVFPSPSQVGHTNNVCRPVALSTSNYGPTKSWVIITKKP
jgi:hypothetical protein